jgi:NADH:ubiquinone oxidoreductase subunit E
MLGLHRTTTDNETRHPQRRRTPRVLAVAVMAGLILGAAACSSSGGSATAKTTTTTIAIDPATAQADIATSYNTLFNLSNPSLAGKLVVIQNGQQITTALQQALSSSEASASQGSKVDSINILTAAQCAKQSLPPQCAHVVYDILGTGGTAILPMNNGYAVFTGGKWLVAKVTICTLLGLFYSAEGKTGSPPGC